MKTILTVGLVAGLFLILPSCRKNNSGGDDNDNNSLENRQKDTAAAYARDIYLWYEQIPANFNGRNYSDLNDMMENLRAYSKEPGFRDPVDRWSFAMKKADWDNVSGGIAQDFGINIFFRVEGDLRVRMVEKSSPAGLAGVRRGWRLTKINGNTNITTGNANFIVDAVYNSNAVSITFQKPDGTSVDLNLNAATYQEHPVYLDSVYNVGGKKAGYMVYNSFLGDSTETVNEFARVINRFISEDVDDVIVDLRYNGGGYVLYQEVLANYLAPTAANGQLMMTQEFNDKYASLNSSENFSKKGTLNLPRIFFIVSPSTASASELLINNLAPFMDVVLIGPDNTFGKPVGYFNIPVGDWYIFPVSMRTTNNDGEGNYFDGFALDSKKADGLDKDWGDVNESCLASALKYISTGAFRPVPEEQFIPDPAVVGANQKISAPEFKGMITNSRPLR